MNGFITKDSDLDCGITFNKTAEASLHREAFWADRRQVLRRQYFHVQKHGFSHDVSRKFDNLPPETTHQTRGIVIGLKRLIPVLRAEGFTVEFIENARIPILKSSVTIHIRKGDLKDKDDAGGWGVTLGFVSVHILLGWFRCTF
jgi:hypothetical protein